MISLGQPSLSNTKKWLFSSPSQILRPQKPRQHWKTLVLEIFAFDNLLFKYPKFVYCLKFIHYYHSCHCCLPLFHDKFDLPYSWEYFKWIRKWMVLFLRMWPPPMMYWIFYHNFTKCFNESILTANTFDKYPLEPIISNGWNKSFSLIIETFLYRVCGMVHNKKICNWSVANTSTNNYYELNNFMTKCIDWVAKICFTL